MTAARPAAPGEEISPPGLHPVVDAAARGILPAWARATPARREHMARVVKLLDSWAATGGVSAVERLRWLAAGWLHDALRDAAEHELRPWLADSTTDWPPQLLHGPAVAGRLRSDGVRDEELLTAVAYHTVGHEAFAKLGKMLYAADFLEPGRRLRPRWRAALRRRMPGELPAVTEEILAARLVNLVERRGLIRRETLGFWNSVMRDQHG